jgi:outer membrane protein
MKMTPRTLLACSSALLPLLAAASGAAQPPPGPPPASPPSPSPAVAMQPAGSPPPAAPPAAPPATQAPPAGGDNLDRRLAPLFAPGSGLVADQVAARAAATSYDVQARQADEQAAAAGVDQALVGYFPRLSGSAGYTRLSPIIFPSLGTFGAQLPAQQAAAMGLTPVVCSPTSATNCLYPVPFAFPVFLNQWTFQATLSVPFSDYLLRTSQQHESAKKSRKAAELNELATRLQVATDARLTYYDWARAKLQLAVAEQALEQARGHATDARHAFEVGNTSKADVLRVDSQVASSVLLVERARHLVSVMEIHLRVLTHDEALQVGAIGEDLRVSPPPLPAERSLDQLYLEALDRRPEIRALDETVGSIKEQAKVARAGYLPRLDGSGQLVSANPNARYFNLFQRFDTTWSLGATISWSPNDTASSIYAAKQIDAHAAQTEAQKASFRDALRNEVAQAVQGIADAETAIETTAQGLAAAEESYRVRRELFRNGRATSVELTDAETDLTQARLATINARIDLRAARVRLLHATGRDAGQQPQPQPAQQQE